MSKRTPNNNFLEDDEEIVEYEEVPEDEITDADEILDEVEGEIEEIEQSSKQISKAFSEAEKRIEQANLYKAILNSSLFAKGSARPEIIKIVDKEFKDFVVYRLEVLLGIKQEGGNRAAQQAPQAASPFSKTEVAALKDLANKLIQRNGSSQPVAIAKPVTPVVNQVQGDGEQTVEPVTEADEEEQQPQRQVKMVKRVVKRSERTTSSPGNPGAKKPKRPKTNNVSEITGQDLGQASNPLRPPVPMPSASMMNAMNAEIAEKNARGGMQATQGMLSGHLKNLIKD